MTPSIYPGKQYLELSNFYSSAGVTAISLVALFSSVPLGIGTLTNPASGLWPTAVAALTLVTALFIAVSQRETVEIPDTPGARRALLYAASLAAFIPLYTLLGFVLSGCLVTFIMMRVAGRESLLLSCVIAIGASSLIYLLFGNALSVTLQPLPWN